MNEPESRTENNEFSSIKSSEIDNLITNDLKSFLKFHNIQDGNLVETKRIDLRASQNMEPNKSKQVYSKPKAERLFAEILKDNSVYPNFQKGEKFEFINDTVTSSSESDDENDQSDCNTLWFERYRQHKLLNSVKKN